MALLYIIINLEKKSFITSMFDIILQIAPIYCLELDLCQNNIFYLFVYLQEYCALYIYLFHIKYLLI